MKVILLKQLRLKDIARKPANKPTSVPVICLGPLSLALQTTSTLVNNISLLSNTGCQYKRSDSLKRVVPKIWQENQLKSQHSVHVCDWELPIAHALSPGSVTWLQYMVV